MNSNVVTLIVPDPLGGGVSDVEVLHALVAAERFVLDMRQVGFVKPYGVVALLHTTRRLAGLSGRRVELANVDRQVRSYLERMNPFEVGGDRVAPVEVLDESWDRKPQICSSSRPSRDRRMLSRRSQRPSASSPAGSMFRILTAYCAS